MSFDFDFHSPEEEIQFPLFKKKDLRVFLKRDDLIHPFISGNKWRKLKYQLLKAQEHNKHRLITFGGAWSNHLLAVACAGAKFGFKTVGFVRGEEISNPVLSMCKLYGMQLHFVSREAYKHKESLFEQHYATPDDLFVDEGGYGLEAVKGCADLVSELTASYDHIFVACGTGATVAGILKGVQERDLRTRVHGVPVLKGGDFIREQVEQLEVDTAELSLHLDYHFGGYAKIKETLVEFVRYFVSSTGVMIEPTYTGKTCFALFDMIRKDTFAPGDRILLVHTGGLTGFLGMYHAFDQ